MSPSIDLPAAPKPLPPIQQPLGSKPKKKQMNPSFLGGEALPIEGQTGTKTLLGE